MRRKGTVILAPAGEQRESADAGTGQIQQRDCENAFEELAPA